MCTTCSTPVARRPVRTRRTMFTFSLLSTTEPIATSRRMSLPDEGLAMMPTRLTARRRLVCGLPHSVALQTQLGQSANAQALRLRMAVVAVDQDRSHSGRGRPCDVVV